MNTCSYTLMTLVVSENGERVLCQEIGKHFDLKEESIGEPKIYLGGHLRNVELADERKAWGFSSSQYVQRAVKNVEEYVGKRDWLLPCANTPITTVYRPELDVTHELNPPDAAYYQSLIGTLHLMVELGRVDICLEVSMMSSHLGLPRMGHL